MKSIYVIQEEEYHTNNMNRLFRDIQRIFRDFKETCPLIDDTPFLPDLLDEKCEEFLQNTRERFHKATDSLEPRQARLFHEIYDNIWGWAYTIISTNNVKRSQRYLIDFLKRFINEALNPWRIDILNKVNLHEQLRIFENEVTGPDIEKSYGMREYHMLFIDVLKYSPRNPDMELRPLLTIVQDIKANCIQRLQEENHRKYEIAFRNDAIQELEEIYKALWNEVDSFDRKVALCMSMHSRIGERSSLHSLNPDILRMSYPYSNH
jgi:hypothetical protein